MPTVNLLVRRIGATRPMTRAEINAESWLQPTVVLVLDDGIGLYSACDPEGNGLGALFRVQPHREMFIVQVTKEEHDGRFLWHPQP